MLAWWIKPCSASTRYSRGRFATLTQAQEPRKTSEEGDDLAQSDQHLELAIVFDQAAEGHRAGFELKLSSAPWALSAPTTWLMRACSRTTTLFGSAARQAGALPQCQARKTFSNS